MSANTIPDDVMRAIPAGWKLVPVEPMPEMLGAWYRYKSGFHFHDEPPPPDTSDYGAYRAMLAAAPNPPSAASSRAEQTGEAAEHPLASSPVANSDWITWNGGECPVPAGRWTTVKFRDGFTLTDDLPEGWHWSHDHDPSDIIAYRVVQHD